MRIDTLPSDIKKMSLHEMKGLASYLEGYLRERDNEVEALIQSNPFWHYKPSTGEISPEARAFLLRYIKEEDIPPKLEGQIDAHLSDANIVGIFGGNQSGKSTDEAIEAYIAITGELPYSLEGIYPQSKLPKKWPVHVRVVGVDYKTFLNNLLPAFQYWVPREYLKNGSWKDSYSSEQNTLFLEKEGKFYGTVEFMTNQQDVESFQGPPRHMIIYDEEPDYDIYQENLMRFTTADRIRILFAMTPTKGLSWVKDQILDRAIDDKGQSIACFKLASVVNPKANLKVLEEIVKELPDYDTIKMRLMGEFVSLSGLIYGRLFSRKVHVINEFPINHDDFVVYRGLDPHMVKPSVCVEVAVDREGNEYVIGTYSRDADTEEVKRDLAQRAFRDVKRLAELEPGKEQKPWRLAQTRCDSSADTTIRALGDRNIYLELKKGDNAIPALVKAEKFAGSIAAGVDTIKKLLKVDERTGKPKLFIFNTRENLTLIKAIESLERQPAVNEAKMGVQDKILEGRHDTHACLRYIHQKPVRWFPPIEDLPEVEGEDYI